MRVIATVGLPGSGKSEAAAVARELGVPVVTMGDVIRAECRDRGLDPATHHGEVAKALRAEQGPGAIAERSLPIIEARIAETGTETVLVDGIRSDTEVDRFEDAFGRAFSLLSIEAPFDVRAERVAARGRDTPTEDGGESLEERDARERGFGMDDAIARADYAISNTDSLAAFRERIETVLRAGPEAVADRTRS
jgi:dephospho-CoA kinase